MNDWSLWIIYGAHLTYKQGFFELPHACGGSAWLLSKMGLSRANIFHVCCSGAMVQALVLRYLEQRVLAQQQIRPIQYCGLMRLLCVLILRRAVLQDLRLVLLFWPPCLHATVETHSWAGDSAQSSCTSVKVSVMASAWLSDSVPARAAGRLPACVLMRRAGRRVCIFGCVCAWVHVRGFV